MIGVIRALAISVAAVGCIAVTHEALAQTPASSPQTPPGAAAPRRADSTQPPTAVSGAPVIYAGDTLFLLYGTFGPFSAGERAAAVSQRLRQLARQLGRAVDSLRVIERDGRSELVSNDLVVMTVLDADALPTGRPRSVVAAEYARDISVAIAEATRRGSGRALILAGVYAVAATLLLLLLLMLSGKGFRRLYRRLDAVRRLKLPALRIQNFELASAERLSWLLLLAARAVRIVFTILLFYVYVPLVLSFFPWTAPYSRRIVGYAVAPVRTVWSGFVTYLPSGFYVAVLVVVTRYVLKLVHAFFRALTDGAITLEGFYPEWAEPTYKLVRVLILAFAAVVVFPYLPGSHTEAFKGISIFLGVLFSLGSSSAVSNVVAGTVLTYTRAFRIGDRVRIGDTIGDVTERSLLVTRLRTIKNVEITIPNASVLSSQVSNYTTLAVQRGLILNTTVTIGYDAPWTQVHAMLISAAQRTEFVARDPSPFVLQMSLDDFYVRYELNAYTDRPDLMAVTLSALHANIQDAFNAEGVEIMSPHYGALRDGNTTTVPPAHRAAAYESPRFRLSTSE
jgi:small-conductance mechanosensitive channel